MRRVIVLLTALAFVSGCSTLGWPHQEPIYGADILQGADDTPQPRPVTVAMPELPPPATAPAPLAPTPKAAPAPVVAAAPAPQPAPPAARTQPRSRPRATSPNKGARKLHVVKKGETLQKISKHYYGTTRRWTKIYEANKDQLRSPDKICANMKIYIP